MLIPREVLFGNPDKAQVRLSPDGQYLSYLAPVDGVLNVWVGPADDLDAVAPVTKDTVRDVRFYTWAYTNQHVLYIQDKGGDENWHLYCTDITTQQTTDLTPIDGVNAQFQQLSDAFPEEVLVGLNDRNPQLHDIYRMNILTGERQLIQQNDQFIGFVTDRQFNVRMAQVMTPDGGAVMFRPGDDGDWQPYMQVGPEDALTTGILDFDKSGTVAYLIDSRNRNTSALMTFNLETEELSLLAEHPDAKADMSDHMIHPTERTIQAVAFTYERKQWQILDEAIQADLDYLKTVADGDVEVMSRTHDDQQWIVAFLMDNGPVRYYHYDRTAKSAKFLFTNSEKLEKYDLAKMHPVVIDTRDGMKLVSYYTLPLGSDSDGDGIPDKPVPMVLYVHGGPWARDNWGYNPIHQWLANRGYAVLSVNFRSSVGLGKDFLNAGNKEWGRAMHNDLLDAVDWAVEKGITNRNQVAIMGGSYGGYATLAGLTLTPEAFACGVDIVGPSNLITLLESVPPYWKPMIALFHSRMGNPEIEAEKQMLIERSPLTHVENIKRPLLIGQGANDPRVKQAESDQIVTAMQQKNIPVTYVLYPDEGHGFARRPNRLSFFAVSEAFLAAHLEGEYEPIGDAFTDSTLQVLEGADQIPGLKDALPV